MGVERGEMEEEREIKKKQRKKGGGGRKKKKKKKGQEQEEEEEQEIEQILSTSPAVVCSFLEVEEDNSNSKNRPRDRAELAMDIVCIRCLSTACPGYCLLSLSEHAIAILCSV